MATSPKNTSRPSEIEGLKLAKPAQRALASAGITRLAQLARATDAELLALHGMGPNALRTIRAALAASSATEAPTRARARPARPKATSR